MLKQTKSQALILQTQRPPHSSHLKGKNKQRNKQTIPVKLGEVLPGAPVKAKFHPARRIQDAKPAASLCTIRWSGSLKHTPVFDKLGVQSGIHIPPSTGPYRHADIAAEPGDRTVGRTSPTTLASRCLAEGTWPSPSTVPSPAVPRLTQHPTYQTLGFVHVGETTNPAEFSATVKKNYTFWQGSVGLFLLPVIKPR